MIDRAQGLCANGCFRNQSQRAAAFGGVEQCLQQRRVDIRHVAGNQQIPGSSRSFERGQEPSQGASPGQAIGDNRESQTHVAFRRADDRRVACGFLNLVGHARHQRGAIQDQQGLILAHPGTPAPGKNESGMHRVAAWLHEMMVASVSLRFILAILVENKPVYICSILGWMLMAASPMHAAPPSPSVPATQITKFVVRVDRKTGKLVRSAVVPKPATPSKKRAEYAALVQQAARTHQVDPLLIDSVIQVESNYDPYAVSPKGAEGLMQLMPPTARMLGVSNSFDPQQNIEAGVRYLKQLQDTFKDTRLALAAYNAGPGSVEKYKFIRETSNYVTEIDRRYQDARRAADQAAAASLPVDTMPESKPANPALVEETYHRLEQFVDEQGRLHLRTSAEK